MALSCNLSQRSKVLEYSGRSLVLRIPLELKLGQKADTGELRIFITSPRHRVRESRVGMIAPDVHEDNPVFARWSVRHMANHQLSNMPQELQLTPGMPSAKRNLLICFDAFGTLFSPKRPVAQQYAEVASSMGPRPFTEDEVQSSFKIAFKSELKRNPNYGKATNMSPETWWTNVSLSHAEPFAIANLMEVDMDRSSTIHSSHSCHRMERYPQSWHQSLYTASCQTKATNFDLAPMKSFAIYENLPGSTSIA